MPFALDEIRKLGRLGHEVHAADTFSTSPGNHSRFAAYRHVVPSPRYETPAFVEAVGDLVRRHEIDLILPQFEEALFLAREPGDMHARVFAPGFETLRTLHDKVAFHTLAAKLGLPVPRSTVAHCPDGLRQALRRYDGYLARPAYSRGGVDLLTNCGPRADDPLRPRPTHSNPWIVQEYVRGVDHCSYSIVRDGRVTAHCTYVHPRSIEHAGGIVFESVEAPQTLELAQAVAEATSYEGQLSFDLRSTERGFVLLECNPRPTAGVCLMPTAMFDEALFGPMRSRPLVVPAGRKRKMTLALVRDMVVHPHDAGKAWPHLISPAADLYAEPGDLVPAIYQVLTFGLLTRYRRVKKERVNPRTDVIAAYTDDVSFDG
jgi:predicted ATP-grasp superfamily ATP-dependent carboligase